MMFVSDCRILGKSYSLWSRFCVPKFRIKRYGHKCYPNFNDEALERAEVPLSRAPHLFLLLDWTIY